MDDKTLGAVVSSEISTAIGHIGQIISKDREEALNYYLGKPFGNEQEGRSQVVMTVVRDSVHAMLPQLMKIFTGGENVVAFEPQGPEDEEVSKQATEYINYVLMRDNPGYQILYDWFWDALVSKVGVVKWWWDESTDVTEESYQGQSEEQFVDLASDDEIEVLEHTERQETKEVQDPQTGLPITVPATVHDLKVRRTSKNGKPKLGVVPPEEMLVSRDATCTADARAMMHRSSKTVSELNAMGLDKKKIEDLPTEDAVYWSTEGIARRQKDDETGTAQNESLDPSMRRVTIVDGWYRIDADGDGIAELRHIISGSNGDPILLNEIWSGPTAPFAALCPIPLPHRFFGLSIADVTKDIQLISSTATRQLLDNMYGANNNRLEARMTSGDSINFDDLLTNRPNQIVRTKDGAQLVPIPFTPIGTMVYPLLEYLSTVLESRVGYTRMSQGLDTDALNKMAGGTATGVSRIMSAGEERCLLIARTFAETGVKDLFRGLLQLVCEHQSEPRTVRLTNNWVKMDPREWATLSDVSINVALGSGSKQEQMMALMQVLQLQQNIAAAGNPGQIVGPAGVYNAASKVVEAAGLKTPSLFFNDPKDQPPQQPQPSPEMMKVQGDLQAQQAKAQADVQLAQQKAMFDAQHQQDKMKADAAHQMMKAQADIEISRQKLAGEMAMQRENMAQEFELKRYQVDQELQLKGAQIAAELKLKEKAASQVNVGGKPG